MQKKYAQLWLALAFALFVFAKFWEPGVGLDSATYGAVARGILQSGSWFSLQLAPGIFDPFIEHPYLGIWLQALSLRIWGETALGLHFSSSVLGILGVTALFLAVRRWVDESTAFLTCFCLLLINVFMNFMSSGWLDMPMISFILIAFYFATRAEGSTSILYPGLCGLFLSLAVLTKGLSAIGILPVAVLVVYQCGGNWRALAMAAFSFVAPLSLFTLAHYQAEGFIFWSAYAQKQIFVHNELDSLPDKSFSFLWYPLDTFKHAHLVALLFLPGIYYLWKGTHRVLALVILAEVLLHFFAYAFSSRQNRQYILPIFPWLAVAAASFIGLYWKPNALKWSRGVFALSVVYFTGVSFLPVTVHTMSGADIYAFAPSLANSKVKDIYFPASEYDRIHGEMTSSFIAWYLHKVPVMYSPGEETSIVAKLTDSEAVLIPRNSEENNSYLKKQNIVCGFNESWILVSTAGNCRVPTAKNQNLGGANAEPN